MTVIVTMKDIRTCKMCADGTKKFFIRHEMDWKTFIKQGLPESEFLRTGDAQALEVVEAARGRQI